jgi:ribosomal protein S18 acetylase RimI-like enzyme
LEFAITRCRVGDERRLSLVGKATFLETYADNTEATDILAFVDAEHSAERYRLWLESDFAKIWIAETIPGHSAIGYAVALTPSDDSFGIEIKRLYVLHRFHQNGLGHQLLNEILATARHQGIAELFLRVQKANQSAVAFYSRNGFHVVGGESFRVGARDHEALVMRRALDAPYEGWQERARPQIIRYHGRPARNSREASRRGHR